MINDSSKEHFTEYDMIQFWRDNHKRVTSSDHVKNTKQNRARQGMFFSGKNSIVILKDGEIHSLMGPAFITMYPHIQQPAGKDYYVNGERLDSDSFKRRVLEAKSKLDKETYRDRLWV